MMRPDRFRCTSSSLDLGSLVRKSRRALFGTLALALLVHVALSRFGPVQVVQQAAKPLTTQFVKRQPRLTKPLELKKRPRPKQRHVQRQMIVARARASGETVALSGATDRLVRQLARPAASVSRATASLWTELEPRAVAGAVEGSKEAAQQVDLGLEMVDVEALDTGQYQAMIVQDPADKRNVKGFFHLARVYSVNTPPEEAGLPYPDPTALGNLVAAINRYTEIKADIAGTYTLDSQELLKTPFIFITCHLQFRLNESERVNLGKYLDGGGFLFADDCFWMPAGPADACLRSMIGDALDSRGLRKGSDYTWETLPNNHPLYHCYFELDGAPRTPWTRDRRAGGGVPIPPPQGITLHGRLAAVYSNWDIGCGWEGPTVYRECVGLQHHRLLQLGINMLIFAMTQEGSITHRILAGVNY